MSPGKFESIDEERERERARDNEEVM